MPQPPDPNNPEALSSGNMPRIFWILVAAGTVLAVAILIFFIVRGVRSAQRQVEAQKRQQVVILLQQAADLRAEGRPQEALAAYQQVLRLDPENEEAIDGIGRLLETAAQPASSPTPGPPTPTPTPLNPIAVVWADAQALYNAGRWEEAIARLRQVQATDPNFQAEQVEEMLYTAYVSLGTEKSNAGRLEEAVNLFDRALSLRPDAVEIRTIRDVTAQYLDALTYWYADWPKVIQLLEDLYRRSPGYRDVRQRLHEAHVEYGDSLARQDKWCAAAQQYAAALQVQNAPGLTTKRQEAQTLCTQQAARPTTAATTTPGPGGAPAAPTEEAGASPNIVTGLGTGRILYGALDPVDNRFRIFAQPVTANVQPLVLAEDAMQPDLRADGQRLAFRSMRGDQRGLGGFDPATGLRLRFTNFAEDMLPSWNPEGNRLVFASTREGDRRWRIYVAWADGNDNGSWLTYGQDPAWHPSQDKIVYRGCDDRGNRCGLWTMDGSGAARAPLTDVPSDAHPTWSPKGRYVVFQSQERDGNWDLYRIDVNTKAIVRLTTDPGLDGAPAVSPDGSRVAFLSNRDGAWKIWIKPMTGGPAQLLAPVKGNVDDWLVQKLFWAP